ncbi:zonular occludens toxin domain-containing protein [Neisseria sp. S1]|uniref:zonular occludens toxin domain-containing protein n=1 Tax=Neisseria sp. S1 TaxID=3318354 RepID=UPI003A8657C3
MIYLITGNMGTGKTSRVVNMILTNEDGLFKMTLGDGAVVDRPLYFCHIDGLDKKKFKAHELTEEEIQAAPLRDVVPEGAILIVDEAHYCYPVRPAGRPVPPYIQELTELRHHGHTVILMTQHPSQLDVFVRNLVSKHIHLERKSIGMKQYWWYKCVTSLDNPAGLSGTESSSWKPPKAAFQYYKSSSQHQKFKKNIPKPLIALFVILPFLLWKAYGVYQSYSAAVSPPVVSAVEQPSNLDTAAAVQNQQDTSSASFDADLKPVDFVPTLAEKPESKPIYNQVRQVKTFERLAACILGGESGCTCYSDQATPLKEVNDAMCRDYAVNGLPFNPYLDDSPARQQFSNGSAVSPAASVSSFGGQDKLTLAQPDYSAAPSAQ